MTDDIILSTRDLKRYFNLGGGMLAKTGTIRAVDGVTLDIRRGETFAIVGESGCGKSTLARLLMRLLQPTSGEVTFDGWDIATLNGRALSALRRDMQFIFQDPFSSLNPRMSVGRLIAEPLETHFPQMTAADRREKVAGLLRQVGLRPEHAGRYPHEFSGGQRQRIGIARALASGPKLIIGDEPVSALDVSVQAQVINLLGDLRDDLGLTLIIIAHDLAVIRHMSDRVAVMYLGEIVEIGTADEIFETPRHPYTLALLSAIPVAEHGRETTRIALIGETPSPAAPPPGCRFHTRCPFAKDRCRTDVTPLRSVKNEHRAACHLFEEIARTREETIAPAVAKRQGAAEARFALYRSAIEGRGVRPQDQTQHDREETIQ